MKTTDLDTGTLLLDSMGERPPRSPGLHLTDILHYIEEKGGRPNPRRGRDLQGWEEAAAVGMIWEDAMSGAMASRMKVGGRDLYLLGEIVDEETGIAMTPDRLDPTVPEIWEFKFTWRSMRQRPEEIWIWMGQVKGYCRAVGTRTAVMAVMHCCGDWQPPKPVVRVTRIEFTEREIEENWQMVRAGAKAMVAEMGKGENYRKG